MEGKNILNNAQSMHPRADQTAHHSGLFESIFMKNNIAKSMVVAIAASAMLTGCAAVQRTGANMALGFVEKNVVPVTFAQDDTNMICVSGTSLLPAILAMDAQGGDATKMEVLLYTSAASCAEDTALEHELAYLRAAHDGRVNEAQDQRLAQKNWSALAARRQYTAYQLFQKAWERDYKIKLGDQCPTMKTDLEKTVYLLGMIDGVKAVTNDIASQGAVNVPKDIAAVVERGMGCLDNNQYWGAPMAMRAAIWTLLPGAGEGHPDPWQTMKDSNRIGESKGVRISHAIYALAAQATGQDDKIRDALRTYGKTVDANMPVNPQYKLFDAMGGHEVWNIANRYWTTKTGKRAPEDGLTKFWDEADASIPNTDDLLN